MSESPPLPFGNRPRLQRQASGSGNRIDIGNPGGAPNRLRSSTSGDGPAFGEAAPPAFGGPLGDALQPHAASTSSGISTILPQPAVPPHAPVPAVPVIEPPLSPTVPRLPFAAAGIYVPHRPPQLLRHVESFDSATPRQTHDELPEVTVPRADEAGFDSLNRAADGGTMHDR